jgi:tetratricopeptide (TPR) repeat protein
MRRFASHFLSLAALFFGCAAGPGKRPPIDESAMREAMDASRASDDGYASSASYAHYLRSRLAHFSGEHRRALDELRLALATDEGNPLLTTALAEEYARLSDLDRAEHELLILLERHPNYQPAHLMMGKVQYEAQKLGPAAAHLRRAIRLKAQDPEAYLVLAQLQLEQNAPDEAVKTIEAFGAAAPGEPIGYRRLGLAFVDKGDYGRAEKLLLKSVDIDRGDAETWVALARLFEATRRLEKAEDAYDKALVEDPDSREVLLAAGRLAVNRGSVVRARAYFDRLLAISEDPDSAAKVALAYLAGHQFGAASEVLDSARSSGASDPRISFYSGLVHERLQQFAQAVQAYGEVPRDSELFQEAVAHRASSLSLAGQHGKALELFQSELKERPHSPVLLAAYARALERSGSRPEAESVLKAALQFRSSPELLEALADFYQRNERTGEAIVLLTQALTQNPRDETLLYTLGAAYERKGDFDKAIAQMRQLLKINPDHAAALNFIGYSLTEKGKDLDEAERLVNRALELDPESGAFLDSLGWLYFRRGDYQRAVDTLERAAALDPDEPLIIEHLGDAYRRTAKNSQAASAYRRALDALIAFPDREEKRGQKQGLERKLKTLSTEATGR